MILDLNIQVFEPKQRYTGDDTINGLVVLTVHSAVEVENLLVSCQCSVETSINIAGHTYRSKDVRYKKEKNHTIGTRFVPGTYQFPFEYILPTSTKLPETYSSGRVALNGSKENKSGTGNVVWEIKASIPRFKLFEIDLEASHQFWFIPTLQPLIEDPYIERAFPPIPVKIGNRFWRGGRSKGANVYFNLSILESGIHQGPDGCGMKIEVRSDIERTIFLKSLRVAFEATTTFKAKNHHFDDTSVTTVLHIRPNLPLGFDPINLGMCLESDNFALPVVFYGSIDCRLISLRYTLHVEADIGSLSDSKLIKTLQVTSPVNVRPLQTPNIIHVQPEGLSDSEIDNTLASYSHGSGGYSRNDDSDDEDDDDSEDSEIRRRVSETLKARPLVETPRSPLGSAFTPDIDNSPFQTIVPGAPIVIPRELHAYSRLSYSSRNNSSLQQSRSHSSFSLDQLWEPEFDDDIAALIFKDQELSLQSNIRKVTS